MRAHFYVDTRRVIELVRINSFISASSMNCNRYVATWALYMLTINYEDVDDNSFVSSNVYCEHIKHSVDLILKQV